MYLVNPAVWVERTVSVPLILKWHLHIMSAGVKENETLFLGITLCHCTASQSQWSLWFCGISPQFHFCLGHSAVPIFQEGSEVLASKGIHCQLEFRLADPIQKNQLSTNKSDCLSPDIEWVTRS